MEFMDKVLDLIEIPRVNNIKYSRQDFNENQFVDGAICLTTHHLIFIPIAIVDLDALAEQDQHSREIWLLHSQIDSVEMKTRETRGQLVLKCKNFQIFVIDFGSLSACQSVYKSLDGLSNLNSDIIKYPFFYKLDFKLTCDGWNLFDVDTQFSTMFNVSLNDHEKLKSIHWRISSINSNYQICSSYPTRVIVPANVDDETIKRSSEFRAHGRFPVLSYYHKPNESFMLRSSQPLLGSSHRRCKEDELMLKRALPAGKKGYIYDLRDASVLKSAASKGGGYETDANYPLWKRVNMHMDRPEQLHASLTKLVDVCCNSTNQVNSYNFHVTNAGYTSDPSQQLSSDKWTSKLDSCGWLASLRNALYVACCIANELHNKNGCVLVHGWDGMDNTLVVVSLVHLILNQEYRTINGFLMLIECEWLKAGHPFRFRSTKSAFGSTSQKYEGPVFLLFLDCVRLLAEQFCLSFEFNDEFLLILADHVYASQFGTFLGNNERERDLLKLVGRTISLWSYINTPDVIKQCTNPLYEPNPKVIWPSLYLQSFTIWSSLFLRFQRYEMPLREAKNEIHKLIEADQIAMQRVQELTSELNKITKAKTKSDKHSECDSMSRLTIDNSNETSSEQQSTTHT